MVPRSLKPLSLSPDEADLALHAKLCDPVEATRRLCELVPLLNFIGFKAELISAQKTVVSAFPESPGLRWLGPYDCSAYYLLASYTVGIGMFGMLPGCYAAAVHDPCPAVPLRFDLRQGLIRHFGTGGGRLCLEIEISPDAAFDVRQELVLKKRCELTHDVSIKHDDTLIAVGTHTMAARQE